MKERLLLFVLLVLVSSCNKVECNCELKTEQVIKNDSLVNIWMNSVIRISQDSIEHYFTRYKKSKLFLNEGEKYRLSVISLSYNFSKIYELFETNGSYYLQVDEFYNSKGGAKEVGLFKSDSIDIGKKKWKELISKINENCFWVIETDIKEDDSYLDGSIWTLEGIMGENNCTKLKYHMAFRNSPDSSGFLNICEEFFKVEALNGRNIIPW